VRACCGPDGSSFLVVVAWSFVRFEDKSGSITALVANVLVGNDSSVASGGEETESSGALATGPDVTPFCVDDGGGSDCNSATAAARLVGHRVFLIWSGE
jgi:hypothetical protein